MTNSSLCLGKIGDRIACAQYHGTVKYIGPVEGQPGQWLGVDWDKPERGKHNGNVAGVQYFTTRHPTSGTFVRPEKVNWGKSAISSIMSRYGQSEDEFTAKIIQQKQILIKQTMNAPFLEMVGFDKVFHKQSDFGSLRVVNLRDQGVNCAGLDQQLGETCPNIEELDVSKNLLTSWKDIFNICSQLPSLHWLNVSENLLEMPENYMEVKFYHVQTLICGSMELNWNDVLKIAAVYPNIEEFRAPFNKIEELTPVESGFANVKLLDLEGNKIEKWSEICKLDSITTLEQLIIEDIGLTSIEFSEDAPKVSLLKNLRKLCIVNNLINEWHSIGELNRLQNLEHLRVSKNPILDTEDKETVHQLVMAKIANLKILNGVEIEASERRGAEYDYIKKYGLEWLKVKGTVEETAFLKTHNRYMELIEEYGEPEESELVVKPKIIQSSLINLKISYEDTIVEKKLPYSITIQKLLMLVQKQFRLPGKPQLIYISGEDSRIEISLDDEMKEIGLYSMQDGDLISVRLS